MSFFFRGEERGVPLINPSAECMQTADCRVSKSEVVPNGSKFVSRSGGGTRKGRGRAARVPEILKEICTAATAYRRGKGGGVVLYLIEAKQN